MIQDMINSDNIQHDIFHLFYLANCEDKKSQCPRWAEVKYCTQGKFVDYMKQFCKKSCGLCGKPGKCEIYFCLQVRGFCVCEPISKIFVTHCPVRFDNWSFWKTCLVTKEQSQHVIPFIHPVSSS